MSCIIHCLLRPVFALLCFLQLVHTSWWYLGVLGVHKVPPTMPNVPGQPRAILVSCNQPHLSPTQQRYCRRQTFGFDRMLMAVSQGAEWGIKECQYQFKTRRWNCTTFENDTSVFGKVLRYNSREKAFIYAISCAGVVSSVMRRCAKGNIMEFCRCDERWHLTQRAQKESKSRKFKWGGCSHDWRYASSFARQFLDKKENPREPAGLMARWNNRAGRKSVKHNMRLMCKCHGLSGSCSTKVCWRSVQPFRVIGNYLKSKFDGASKVRFVLKSGLNRGRLKPENRRQKRPNKRDLVYLDDSPDFCRRNHLDGSMGTHGRECNRTSLGVDGCSLMCCGRGHNTVQEDVVKDCKCRFIWCCRVVCQKCKSRVEKYYCK